MAAIHAAAGAVNAGAMTDQPAEPGQGESLIDRALRIRPAIGGGSRAAGAGVALLLMLAPVATITGARLMADRAATRAAALEARAQPAMAAGERAERARDLLRGAIARPGVGVTLDGLARALPPEATLVSATRDPTGALTIEVAAIDPDRLRAALRRDPATAGLRDAGQQRGAGGMTVTLVEQPR